MNWKETGLVTLNSITLALWYTLLGVFISFVLYYLFEDFDEDWKKRPIQHKVMDVSLEIALLATIAFWSSHIVRISPAFFPVRRELDLLVDSYISGVFFLFAIFIFMDALTDKLKHLFDKYIGPTFENIFPKYGSIVDMSLSFSRKTETV
jgi:hypothetical protein